MPKKPLMGDVVDSLPAEFARDARQLVPLTGLRELGFFKKLKEKDQKDLMEHTRNLVQAKITRGISELAMGEEFAEIQRILKPYNAFTKFIRSAVKEDVTTVYRWIAAYQAVAARLPKSVIKAAIANGMHIYNVRDPENRPLGEYTEVVRQLPPPNTEDSERVTRYVQQLDDHLKERKQRMKAKGIKEDKHADAVEPPTPTLVKRMLFRFIVNRLDLLKRDKLEHFDDVVGMVYQKYGVASRTVKAQAVPEDFPAQVGRPRLENVQ